MQPIKDPFPDPINYNEIPVDQIPKEWTNGAKERLMAQAESDRQFETGLAELSRNPEITEFLMVEAHKTVSRFDDHVIRSVFYTALSAYLSPLNLALKAESGAGKSYTTMEMVNFLPQENVLRIGSQSPKVISHENGVRKCADGRLFSDIPEPQKPSKSDYPNPDDFCALMEGYKNQLKEYRELADNSFYEVDLKNKVIVFLESVNPETFKMLKATMSHDHDFIDHKFVDERGKVHITRLLGAPVLIFNSLDAEYMEEFATRTLTVTPNTSKEKIQDAMSIACKKANYPWLYAKDALNRRLIQEYIKRIRDLTVKGCIKALNPFTDLDTAFSQEATRDMRDFSKFLELMPSFALFKLFQRPLIKLHDAFYLIPTVQDAIDAKAHFDSVSSTTKTGTEQRILNFYWEHVADIAGSTIEGLTDSYNQGKKKKLSSNGIRNWVRRLEALDWVDVRTGEQTRTDGKADYKTVTVHPLKVRGDASKLLNEESLKAKLEERFKNWLKVVSQIEGFTPQIILPNIDGSANKLTLDEFEKLILSGGLEDLICETRTQPETVPVSEKNPVDISNSHFEESAATSNLNNPTLTYRELSPVEKAKCDGQVKGDPCPLLAEYEFQSSDNPEKPRYCKKHFDESLKACESNGFPVRRIEESALGEELPEYREEAPSGED